MKYSDKAKSIASYMEQEGVTLTRAASFLGIERTKASRLVALLDCTNEVIEMVDKGELPLNQPEKALKKKQGRLQPVLRTKVSQLPDDLQLCLEVVFNRRFVTVEQLSEFLGGSVQSARLKIKKLSDYGYVDIHDELKPYVFSASAKGCVYLGMEVPKRLYSASAMHQYLMVNIVHLDMCKRLQGFRFIPRGECWGMGFFPSHGEHFAQYNKGGKISYMLVIIDDYMMSPSRIGRSFNRKHNPPTKNKKRARGFVEEVFVFTTSDKQKKSFENYIGRYLKKDMKTYSFRAAVVRIQSIWSVY